MFPDKLDACRKTLKDKGQEITDENCFLGFDAYQKVIDSGVDVVLLCTPPVFRPMHFEYAIEKGKHCFIEKPCAVDPVGAKRVLVTAKKADQQGLSVISGTIRRSQKDCIETYRRVAEGAIGDIVSAHVTRLGGALWYINRRPEWNDMEYMLRNWVNFCWTSGDLVVEQFVHEIDMMSWFMGDKTPVRAEATGGRQRRVTGDMYDFFSIEYVYDNGLARALYVAPDQRLRYDAQRDGVRNARVHELFRYDLQPRRHHCLAVPEACAGGSRPSRWPFPIRMCRN